MYLGLDLGTSGLKGVIVDSHGQIHATHTAPLTVSRPHNAWSEQEPSTWTKAADEVLRALKEWLPQVRAIGLSGQMHGAVCLDASGEVIRPAILWNDTRAAKEAARLDADDTLKSIFGNITFPGFTAPKILWMKTHEPENYARIAKVLLPKDYLRYWLSGEMVSDMSDASGTAWLDISARSWSPQLLSASGLETDHMPRLVEGSEASTEILNTHAENYGLPTGTVIAGGAGDNAATALGLDITAPGRAFVSLGTSGVVFAANDGFHAAPDSALHSFCHAMPERWHQMGVTLSASDCLSWLARQMGQEPANLVNELGALSAPTQELFLPFLGGERTPYNSATLRASFHQLSHDTDRAALTRAVLEGVGFSLKICLDKIESSSGQIDDISVVGGGARSLYWLEILATLLDREIARPKGAEHAAALGAARLGAMAVSEDISLIQDNEYVTPSTYHAEYIEKFLAYNEAVALSLN